MFAVSAREIVVLSAFAFAAGTVDAIAGGGGLLTVPILLATGLPPHTALATNKGQSVFGSLAAMVRFARAGLIDWTRARTTFAAGFTGSLAGVALVLAISPERLRPIVLMLLVAAGAFMGIRRPKRGTDDAPEHNADPPTPCDADPPTSCDADPPTPCDADPPPAPEAKTMDATEPAHEARSSPRVAAWAIALVIGAYDGFFGPGTGTFLIVAFVALLGDRLSRATADAKVVNFASNLAAATWFATRGTILWRIALPMAAAQLLGGWLGAHLAVRRGDALVRRAVMLVALVLACRLAWDML